MANETKIKITAETAQAQAALRSFGGELTGFTGKLTSVVGLAGTLGGALSITAFAGFIKSSIDAADNLNDLAQKTGTSVEALAGLKFAADQNGTSLEAVANASKKLATNMAEHPDTFRKFGITAKDSTGALVQMADIFASMPDGAQKTALAVKLMGKSGEEMIPFLNQGSEALRQLTEEGKRLNPITAEMAKQSDQFNDDLARLKMQAGGLGIMLANELLPNLTDTTTAMADLAKEGHGVLALWRGLAGMGKIPWDFLFPPENLKESLSSANRLKELKSELADIENYLKRTDGRGDGQIGKWLHGSPEEQKRQAEVLRNQIAALEKFGAQIDKKPDAPVAPKKDGAKGRSLYDALGGDGKAKKDKPFDPEGDFWFAVDEAAMKNQQKRNEQYLKDLTKAEEETNQQLQRSALEAQAIIFDIDPIAKVSAEWEKLTALKEQGLLTDEQIGKSYAKTFENIGKDGSDAFKSLESAARGWGNEFTDILATGKDGFSGLIDSMLLDMKRMYIQQNITDPLMTAGTGFLGKLFSGMFGSGSAPTSTGATASSWTSTSMPMLPSYAVGTDYVPRDMIAQIHKGERIIPAAQNNGGGSAAPNVTVNVVNQSGQNVNAKQQGGPQFDGRDWVIGVVLEAADNNPNFRNAMGMA